MSNKCIYQSDFPEINEARCIIPLDLKKGCDRGQGFLSCGSWFCEFRGKEQKCPIVKTYKKYAKNKEI